MLGAGLLASCSSRDASIVEGTLAADVEVGLERGPQWDAAQREIPVDRDSTFVIIAREDDADVKLRVSHGGIQGIAPASMEVESFMLDTGLEIAVLDAPRGTRLTVSLTGPQDFAQPRKIPLKVFQYEDDAAWEPRAAARIAALRAWAAATDATLTGADIETKSIPSLDAALGYLESANGDPALAAWGYMLRSRFNYRRLADLKIALNDARRAEKSFAALADSRNTARARFLEAVALVELATDRTQENPGADDAARETEQLLTSLREEPALSAFERARSVGYLGAHYFNMHQWAEARATFLKALSLYDAIGYRHGRRQVLTNLGVMSSEDGDFRAASRYFDMVMPEIDKVGVGSQRVMVLYSAASADTYAGNTDRAIDRLLRAQAVARTLGLKQYESLILYGLGRAYWARGDLVQATTLLGEALKLRRTLDGGIPLLINLRASGVLARDVGDFQSAIALHREVESLSYTPEMKLSASLDLALDYTARSDYGNAISLSRQALSIGLVSTNFHKRALVQLALANALLSQPGRTTSSVREATLLIEEALAAAMRRSDTVMELAARRLLAQSLVARREYGKAREEYERAISLIFKYRSAINNPELRAATLAHEQKTFRGYVDVLMRDIVRRTPGELRPVSAAEESALRTLEWARAVNFDVERDSLLDGETQERIAELLAQMAGKRVRVAALLDRTSDTTRQLEILQLDIAQIRAEVDRLRAAASANAGRSNTSLTLGEAWPALREGVTQLSYALETEHAYLWVRDASGIRATALGATPSAIAQELAKLHAASRAQDPARVEATLAHLSSMLIPVGAIARGTTTIEVVAEGKITAVPFAALSSPGEHQQRLSAHQSIQMISSLFDSILPRSPVHRALGLIAIANDARTYRGAVESQVFSALPGTNAEVRAIAAMFQRRVPSSEVKLLLGAEGSAAKLKTAWNDGVDVIHFATHGLADLRQPLTALLVLPALTADGAPTYLTAGQVQEWRGDANLVYLSACETAVGPARFAEGMSGMHGAFLRAGARGVIATLWPVEDLYASQFAADFYRRYTGGTAASRALSETQRAWMEPAPGMREIEQAHRRMTAWAHAYYAQ